MFEKKSQINMLETIVVLMVFIIFILLVISFYVKISETKSNLGRDENVELDAIKIAQKISYLPELQCSQDNIVAENCIDILKLAGLKDVIAENEFYYFDLFSFSKITINEIYPFDGHFILYDRSLDEYSFKTVANIPILLFDPLNNKNTFGVINIEYYSK